MECDGSCIRHFGEIQRVRIIGPVADWGEFNYCSYAIRADRQNGFKVVILDDNQPGQDDIEP